MNQTQMKYLRVRAEKIFSTRKDELHRKHYVADVFLTVEEKIQAIKEGRYKVRERLYGRNLDGNITFDDELRGGLNREAYNTDVTNLTERFTTLMDELVLGDNAKALELLKNFEAHE